ncbi:MAG: hypothetical protein MPI95_01200 [Nitrosopumilus sp.]|nr:hypothetical protein [Nitrosopumilus sp.]CAI9832155.1 conserved membrane hypothetical protein [Nitrosopumilaceae archaeon]MDA7941350.1 hypothetical protein [Nitrosopumilus sp.]MDA7942760.1 hypothetical protein [Nitrosopumilus sp.]MDA7945356.1 hypothetical protein [Nitrosopumilus sp.]
MRTEDWLAACSVGLFALFSGMMSSMYGFMTDIPEDEYFGAFDADSKLLQFMSIGVAPAGILAAISFLMSRQAGSLRVGVMISAGGAAMLAGMAACSSYLPMIPEERLTPAVSLLPALFMLLSIPVFAVGGILAYPRRGRGASGSRLA